MNAPPILLVAKPWRGGLARYLFLALDDLFPDRVQWWPTYPDSPEEKRRYRRDKHAWREGLRRRLEQSDYAAAIFIGTPPWMEPTRHHEHNVAWIIDAPDPKDLTPGIYGRVFLSDGGYEERIPEVTASGRYAGELPFALLPAIHQPAPPRPATRDAVFIGNRDPKRDGFLAHLLQSNLSATVVGNYFLRHPLAWRHPLSFRPAVSHEGMGAVYARHRCSLNIHAQVVRHGTNMRTFEAAGYGIPQVVEQRPGLERYFEPDDELLTFDDGEEMVAAIQRLRNDPELSRRLATRARERALAEHTYHHRARALLDGLLEIPA